MDIDYVRGLGAMDGYQGRRCETRAWMNATERDAYLDGYRAGSEWRALNAG